MQSTAEPRVSFDGQAPAYEERAGLPEAIGREVAAQLTARAPRVVVDVGAGTGTIGRHLLSGVTYLGIDLSRPMLVEFSRRIAPDARALLLQADADRAWPIKDHSANLILFSRSAHLLKSERTLDQVARIAAPGGCVLVGRVRRARDSAGERLKRAMQQLLRDKNVPGRNGERAKRDFLEAMERRGARPLEPWATSSWTEEEAPIDSIRSWQGKSGLAGRALSAELKSEVLDELQRWAETELGDLASARPVEHCYQLEGVQLAE